MNAEKLVLSLKGDREEAKPISHDEAVSHTSADQQSSDCCDCCDCADCSCDCKC